MKWEKKLGKPNFFMNTKIILDTIHLLHLGRLQQNWNGCDP